MADDISPLPAGSMIGILGEPGAINAALLAAAVLALSNDDLADRLDAYRARQTASVPLFPADTE